MKHLKSLLAALALGLAGTAASALTVQLVPTGPTQAGKAFELQLQLDQPFAGLDPLEEILSFGFKLDFDTTRLQFLTFTPTAGWDDDSPMLGNGQFGASTFPGLENQGQQHLTLATLRFTALTAGPATVHLFTEAGNLNQGLSYLIANPVALDATQTLSVTAVPEPASMLLMALGVVGLMGVRRRSI